MKRVIICMPDRKQGAIDEMDKLYKNEYEVFDAIINEKGYKGISDSFKQVIKNNYEEPYIHILEDDVLFTSAYSRDVFEKNMPVDSDIYLAGSYSYSLIKNNGTSKRIKDFASLHSVVISKKAYDFFLSHDTEVVGNIDRWVSSFACLNCSVCVPFVAIQKTGYSYNQGRKVDYSHMIKDEILTDKN